MILGRIKNVTAHIRTFSTKSISQPMSAILKKAPIIPVLSIQDSSVAVPLVKALAQGKLSVVEIALRTPQAFKAIEQVRKSCGDDVIVGAATVVTVDQFRDAIRAGAQFAASPLYSERLMSYAKAHKFPYTPCVFSTTEINLAAEAGFLVQKLFPMDKMGDGEQGEKFLRDGSTQAILNALGGVKFYTSCFNTKPSNIDKYLKNPSVLAVASGWSAPPELVAARDWHAITRRAKADKMRADAIVNATASAQESKNFKR